MQTDGGLRFSILPKFPSFSVLQGLFRLIALVSCCLFLLALKDCLANIALSGQCWDESRLGRCWGKGGKERIDLLHQAAAAVAATV